MEKRLRKNIDIGSLKLINFINLTETEKEGVRKYRNRENVRNFMYQDHIVSKEEHQKFIEDLKDDKKNFYWLVKDNKGEHIGVISLNRLDLRNKNAYLGIYKNPELKSKGLGSILINCLKNLAFEITCLHALKLEVIEGNNNAISFYKEAGFKKEGILKKFVLRNGKWYDVIVMGIINEKEE